LAEEAVARVLGIKEKLVLMVLAIGLAGGAGWGGYRVLAEKSEPAQGIQTKPSTPEGVADSPPKNGLLVEGLSPPPTGPMVRIGTRRFRHDGNLESLTFSPDGKVLAGAGLNGQIVFWDAGTGKEMRRIQVNSEGRSPGVSAIDYSPDGELLASCCSPLSRPPCAS
jgi:WD40 repeat protein